MRRVVTGVPVRGAAGTGRSAEEEDDEREYRRMRDEGFFGAGGGAGIGDAQRVNLSRL